MVQEIKGIERATEGKGVQGAERVVEEEGADGMKGLK